MGYYQNGVACLNGHKVSGNAASRDATPHCSQCGAATVSQCAACKAPIKGEYHSDIVVGIGGWYLGAYCEQCGKPFPWTAAKVEAARELAEAIEELTEHEREQLVELLPHIMQDTPRTVPAGFKISAIVTRIKGPAKSAMRDLLINMAAEAGKKAMGL